jgi:hypothetical protein
VTARSRRVTKLLLAGGLLIVGCAATRSSSTGTPNNDRAAILTMINDARRALLAGDATRVCSHLTRHGQRRVMGFRVDYDNEGAIPRNDPRLPQTCEAMVHRLCTDATAPDSGFSWPHQLAAARFTVGNLDGDHATVRLTVPGPYGPVETFQVVRTSASWMVDDSNIVPVGY